MKSDTLTVVLEVAILTFAVVLVDERWLRAAIAFVPALLVAQRAVHGSNAAAPETPVGVGERRQDESVRGYIDQLLKHFREFYSTCHLMGSGQIDAADAMERANRLERQLNKLLAEVTEEARGRAAS